MTELFTMIVLAASIIVASAFAKFAPTATAHEQSSNADIFEGRLARVHVQNVRSAVSRRIAGSTGAHRG
jgi:uncharacterized protein (DUF58 family)